MEACSAYVCEYADGRKPCCMSLFPCSGCGLRTPGKLASVTWAWSLANGSRIAWRQRLCQPCFLERAATIPMPLYDAELTCPMCGEGTKDDMDPVYCTAFVPSVGRFDFEWPTCAKCAVGMRLKAEEGAVRLEDRTVSLGAGASGPQTITASDTWRALGIEPRRP